MKRPHKLSSREIVSIAISAAKKNKRATWEALERALAASKERQQRAQSGVRSCHE